MRLPIHVTSLEAINPLVAEVVLRTSPEGARFLARFMYPKSGEAHRADVIEVGADAPPPRPDIPPHGEPPTWTQDAPDHWSARYGDHTLSVWPRGFQWEWEVMAYGKENDERIIVGRTSQQDTAQRAAFAAVQRLTRWLAALGSNPTTEDILQMRTACELGEEPPPPV